MAIGDIIVAIDIGASKTAAIVGQVNKFSEIEVVGYGLASSEGIKKGRIINKLAVSESIVKAVTEAEETSGLYINSAYVNIKGINTRIEKIKYRGSVEKPDDGLSYNDIYNVFEQIQLSISKGSNEQIIDIIPHLYSLNDRDYKEEPIGAFCKEFVLDADIVIANGDYLKDVVEVMKNSEIKIDGIIMETLAAANVVLMPEEKDMGVLMLDIGAAHTDISIYKNNRLEYYATLPVGGDHITNDIALSLNISNEEAEKLKKQYNLALQAMISNDHDIKLNTVKNDADNNVIRCSDVVAVIEARVKEIYQIVRKMIADNNLVGKAECAVITGQGLSNIVGAEELAVLTLKVNQIRICSPKLINVIKPQHTVAFGMVKHISTIGLGKHVDSDVEIAKEQGLKQKIGNFFKKAKEKMPRFNKRNIEEDQE